MSEERSEGRRYAQVQALVLALFSPAVYRDVALYWRGLGLGYLFLLLVVTWLPPMGMLQAGIDDFATTVAPSLLEQLPTITIKGGEVTIDGPQPVVLRDPQSGTALAVLDATDGPPPAASEDAVVVLGRTTLTVRRPDQRDARVVTLADSPFADAVIDRDRARTGLEAVQRWFVLSVAYPVCLVVSWVYRSLEALLYGMVALRLAGWLRRPLTMRACMRLAAVAMTPVILLDTVIGVIGTPPPLWPLSYFLLTLGYVYLGVSAVPPAPGAESASAALG